MFRAGEFLAGHAHEAAASCKAIPTATPSRTRTPSTCRTASASTHQFTLNYGLRWDYFGVIAEDNNLLSNFNPASGVLSQVGTNGLGSLYQPDHRNFAPRASVAYDLNGKGTTVIRSGGGIFYDVFSQDFFLGQVPYDAATPGSAYNDIGPKPILSSSTVATQIVSGQPVFTRASAPRRTCSPWTSTSPPLHVQLQLEYPAAVGQARRVPGRLRRVGRPSSVPLP